MDKHDADQDMQTIVQVNLYRMPYDTPEFLLLRRISEDNDPSEALWQPISAKVEGDGSIADTLQNAIKEQVGLEGFKRLSGEMYTYEWYSKEEQGRDIVFSAEVEPNVEIRLDSSKYGDYAWLPFSDAEQRLKWDGNKEALRRQQAAIIKDRQEHPRAPQPEPEPSPETEQAEPPDTLLQPPAYAPYGPVPGTVPGGMPAMPIVQPAYPASAYGYAAMPMPPQPMPQLSPYGQPVPPQPAPGWNSGYGAPQSQGSVIPLPVYTGPGATPPPPPPPPVELEDQAGPQVLLPPFQTPATAPQQPPQPEQQPQAPQPPGNSPYPPYNQLPWPPMPPPPGPQQQAQPQAPQPLPPSQEPEPYQS